MPTLRDLPRDRRPWAARPRPRWHDVFRYALQAARRRPQTRCCRRPAASAAEISHRAIQSAVGANQPSSDAPKNVSDHKELSCRGDKRCDQVRALPMPPRIEAPAGQQLRADGTAAAKACRPKNDRMPGQVRRGEGSPRPCRGRRATRRGPAARREFSAPSPSNRKEDQSGARRRRLRPRGLRAGLPSSGRSAAPDAGS